MPCAPWHIVQFSASVAPRPTASAAPARAIGRSSTTFVEPAARLRAAVRSPPQAAGHAGGAADARPQALRRRSRCATTAASTKPTARSATTVSTSSAITLRRNHGVAPGVEARRRPSSRPDRDDRHRGLLQRRELRDRLAVVDDRERDHHRDPQAEAVEQRSGTRASSCTARLKV